MRILQRLYLYYCLTVFGILFFAFFPFLLIPVLFPGQFRLVGVINRFWAKSVFTLCFLPFSLEIRSALDKNRQYIFCPNHFSYIDIPSMGLTPLNAVFVGKHEMEKIPLFGFMYRKLHITVDREKLKSRYDTYLKSLEAIDEGKSLVVFPEGGIISTDFPRMSRFKDGAFRLALEKQIPIVPVTIATNWILLPGDETFLTWHPIKLIFHEPIVPDSQKWNVESLKAEVYRIIQDELYQTELIYTRHENQQGNIGKNSTPGQASVQ